MGRLSRFRKSIDLSTPSDGQDTEKSFSEQTADDWLYPSDIIWQQPFRHIEIAERLRELITSASGIISVAIFLQ
jgi:hypothetical protein